MRTGISSSAGQTRTVLRALVPVLALEYSVLILWRLFDTGFQGSDSYSRIARALISDGCFPTAFRPPVYPSFLALMMLVFGPAWEAAALFFQALAGTTCGILVVRAAGRLSDKGEFALPAAILYATNLLFQIEVVSKRETALFTLLLVLFFYAALFYQDAARRNRVMALSAALALLTRPNAVVLVPILLCFLITGIRAAGRWNRVVIPLMLFGAAIMPWQIAVWQKLGRLPLSSSANSGQTLWKGNNPYLLRVWPYVDIDKLDPFLHRHIGGDITAAEGDKRLLAEALEFIGDYPAVAVERALYKSLLFFSPVPLPLGNAVVDVHGANLKLNGYRYRSSIQLGVGTLHGIALLAGWLSFVLLEWRSERNSLYVRASLALTLLLCALHSLTYPEARYRQPMDITATPLAAAGLVLVFRRRTRTCSGSEAAFYGAPQEMNAASPRR